MGIVVIVIAIIGMVVPEKQRKCSTKCQRGVDMERALLANGGVQIETRGSVVKEKGVVKVEGLGGD